MGFCSPWLGLGVNITVGSGCSTVGPLAGTSFGLLPAGVSPGPGSCVGLGTGAGFGLLGGSGGRSRASVTRAWGGSTAAKNPVTQDEKEENKG